MWLYFEILFAGGVVVSINPDAGNEGIVCFLEHSECKVVFTSQSSSPTICSAANKLDAVPMLILADTVDGEHKSNTTIITFTEFLSGEQGSIDDIKIFSDDITSIIYTSGATDRPKGVLLTHKNFYSDCVNIILVEKFDFHFNILAILPFFMYFLLWLVLLCQFFWVEGKDINRDEVVRSLQADVVTIFISIPQYFYHLAQMVFDRIKTFPFWKRWIARINRDKSKQVFVF